VDGLEIMLSFGLVERVGGISLGARRSIGESAEHMYCIGELNTEEAPYFDNIL
jgi:hypothetical protein